MDRVGGACLNEFGEGGGDASGKACAGAWGRRQIPSTSLPRVTGRDHLINYPQRKLWITILQRFRMYHIIHRPKGARGAKPEQYIQTYRSSDSFIDFG